MIKIQSLFTSDLNKSLVNNICKLKNSKWKYGIKGNLNWFKQNAKKHDLHNVLFFKKKLAGYTMLRLRKFINNRKTYNYYYFDTLIINKKYRGKQLSSILMFFNNFIIKKKRFTHFLSVEMSMLSIIKNLVGKKY